MAIKNELPPAPWSYRKCPSIHMKDSDMWEVNHGIDTEVVAEGVYGEDAARMIAATPEVIKALISYLTRYTDAELLQLAECNTGMGEISPQTAQREIAARAAIAKASTLTTFGSTGRPK